MPKPLYDPWENYDEARNNQTSKYEPKPEEYSTDYHNRCGHCHEYIGEDRYCKYCGTKRGQGEYKPYLDVIQVIYGPMPIERTHKCKKCGNSYSVVSMVDAERYCPLCGGETIITSSNITSSKDEFSWDGGW